MPNSYGGVASVTITHFTVGIPANTVGIFFIIVKCVLIIAVLLRHIFFIF